MSGACPALSASLPHHTIKNVDVIGIQPPHWTTVDWSHKRVWFLMIPTLFRGSGRLHLFDSCKNKENFCLVNATGVLTSYSLLLTSPLYSLPTQLPTH